MVFIFLTKLNNPLLWSIIEREQLLTINKVIFILVLSNILKNFGMSSTRTYGE